MARLTGFTGPMRVNSNQGGAWAGTVSFSAATTGVHTISVGASYTHLFRSTANIVLTPKNSTAAHLWGGRSDGTTGLYVTISDNATLTFTHTTQAGTATFYFMIVDGGTALS